MAGLTFANNLWWNGGKPLPECGEGPTSILAVKDAASLYGTTDPKPRSTGSFTDAPDLTPTAESPLSGRGKVEPRAPVDDAAGKKRPRPPAIGALEP